MYMYTQEVIDRDEYRLTGSQRICIRVNGPREGGRGMWSTGQWGADAGKEGADDLCAHMYLCVCACVCVCVCVCG